MPSSGMSEDSYPSGMSEDSYGVLRNERLAPPYAIFNFTPPQVPMLLHFTVEEAKAQRGQRFPEATEDALQSDYSQESPTQAG